MTDVRESPPVGSERIRVLIAGGGVAALETAFALRELAGDRVAMTLLAPESEFVYRPMAIGEPFSSGHAARYALAALAAHAGAVVMREPLAAVDAARRTIRTARGTELGYDALVIATGASLAPVFEHATRFDDARLDELLHGLVQDVEGGYVSHLAIVVPSPPPWPLPAYELALMASERAWDTQTEMKVTVLTPESAPLCAFGPEVSEELARLLRERKIELISSAYCEIPEAQTIVVHPGGATLHADRIIALPELRGPEIAGLPQDGSRFVPVDTVGRVRDLDRVWAAGDVTDFPVKLGGVAAQMADTVAQSIAALTGACEAPAPFAPRLEAVLLTGGRARHLRGGWPTGGHGVESEVSVLPRDVQLPKITARYLQPHLAAARPVG
jgi:sulfide:quinone oxidoreductase